MRLLNIPEANYEVSTSKRKTKQGQKQANLYHLGNTNISISAITTKIMYWKIIKIFILNAINILIINTLTWSSLSHGSLMYINHIQSRFLLDVIYKLISYPTRNTLRSATKINLLLLFRETIDLYCENNIKHKYNRWAECRVLRC
jgi:hypothetical protein